MESFSFLFLMFIMFTLINCYLFLFRFVRLGVPTIDLDAQGRARSSICELYRWRYKNLNNLPHVLETSEYLVSNAGFCFDYQLINVEDFNGVGESEPNPYFYQVSYGSYFLFTLFLNARSSYKHSISPM